MRGVGVKSVAFLDGPQVISAGKALIRLAVAQSDPEYLNYVEGVRPMRHTNDMSAPAKFTSLRESNPGLSSEANGWDPSLYSAGSSKKMSWKCSEGHTWDAVISARNRGNGCPFCAGKAAIPGVNDLATLFPDIAKQVVDWDPATVMGGSSKVIKWKCAKSHVWKASVAARTAGSGCPFCANQKVLSGFNDLKTMYPHIANEAFGWDPSKIIGGKSKLQWKCPQGHIYEAAVEKRKAGRNCPICSNKQVVIGINDLATTNPKLAAQAFEWDPRSLTAGSGSKKSWKCAEGHTWQTTVRSRTDGNGCPTCANRKVKTGFNDMSSTHPELALEANGWDPTTVSAGTHKKLSWKCRSGHIWDAVATSRTRGSGCPYCAGKFVTIGENDLTTTHPELAKKADGWDPKSVSAGSHEKKSWLCPKGHKYISGISHQSSGQGCSVCAGKKIIVGVNDLATTHPSYADLLFDTDPGTITAGSHRLVARICELGHTWKSSVKTMISGYGCPYCSNVKLLTGFNDLATKAPLLAAQAIGWDPSLVMYGSLQKKRWKCDQGHEWNSAVQSRTGGSGCPSCTKSGFDPNKESWIYLMKNEAWGMLQIGITNDTKTRLGKHMKKGWELLDIRGPMVGELAQSWETSILQMLQRKKVKFGEAKDRPKKSSVSNSVYAGQESWYEDGLSVTRIKTLMEMVEADEA